MERDHGRMAAAAPRGDRPKARQRSRVRGIAALLAALLMGFGLVISSPQQARAADLKVEILGLVMAGVPTTLRIEGCTASGSSLVVEATIDGTKQTLREAAGEPAVNVDWTPAKSGSYSVVITCLSYSGQATATTKATITADPAKGAKTVCVGAKLTLTGTGAPANAKLSGYLTSVDAFYEEGLFYATKLGQVGTVAADGTFSWTLVVPKKAVSYTYVAVVVPENTERLIVWTFSVKKCTGGGLPTTGA